MSVALTRVPYESDVLVKPVLVGWCPLCECVYDPYEGKGSTCFNDHEWENWARNRYGNGGTRGVLKRRMWKCPNCDGYYLTRQGLLNHDHWWV